MYEHARVFMRANGNATQWPDGYPSMDIVRAYLEQGHAYIVANGTERVAYDWIKEPPRDNTSVKSCGVV